jgi:putative membrane protein
MQLFILVAALIGILSVAFAMQNNVPATVTLIGWQFEGSLAMLLLVAFGLGALFVGLAAAPSALRRQWTIRGQQKKISELEAAQARLGRELADLKARGQASPEPQAAPRSYLGLTKIFAGRDKPKG